MPHEIEIKLRLADPSSFQAALARLHAEIRVPRLHESNVLFDAPDSRLRNHGQLLRIRTETPLSGDTTPRQIVTFKSPVAPYDPASFADRRHKVREETELHVSDAAALQKIFAGLDLTPGFRYEKFRTTYALPASLPWSAGLLIELDETPIGTFAELEGPPEAIDLAARELGFSPSDYILRNYAALYFDHCHRHNIPPSNMLFSQRS